MSRRSPALLAVWVLLLAWPASAERIREFDVTVSLDADGVFLVEERILYDFEGANRHGIYRDIPVRYERKVGSYRVKLGAIGVTDGDGRDRPMQRSSRGGTVRVRIGDPSRTVTGLQEYRIAYRVQRGLLFFEEHDELYWNATGTEWEVPIDSARVTVQLPPGTPGDAVRLGCFTGGFGSSETACSPRSEGERVRFAATRALGAREGLTVAVAIPKGVLREPTAWERFQARMGAFGGVWLLLPFATLAGMFWLWRTRGRDIAPSDAMPVRYDPPDGLTPAEMGVVWDESADLEDVTATILDLAVRGWLTIEEIESTRFLFFTDKDYRLVRKRADVDELKPHEERLLAYLFASGSDVKISSLREAFYTKLAIIKDHLYAEVSGRGRHFPTAPDKVAKAWRMGGVAVLVLGGLAMMNPEGPLAAVCIGVSGLVVIAFAKAMPRRTRLGRRVYEEIAGFREFVGRVDKDRLDRLGTRTAETFERILPFAVVLGVGDAWADAFTDIYLRPPDWYRSAGGSMDFHPRHFVGDVGRGLGTIGRSLASTPRGSGSSGFGGGSGGGGGFSGGGFGGGGGGSW